MKPESTNNPEGRYILKPDMRHYFPGGPIPEQLLATAKCHQRAERWAFYLERDVKDIEERARRMAESTTMSYCEAIDKVSWDILRGKTEQGQSPLSCPLLGRELVRLNRAQRRKARKERRRKHGK